MQPLSPNSSNFTSIPYDATNNVATEVSSTNNGLPLLTAYDIVEVDVVLLKFKASEYAFTCANNVLSTLEKLPTELAEKLTVIIATHECYEDFTYFKIKYAYHVFMIGRTEEGVKIFDAQIPNSTSVIATEWLKVVYEKEKMTNILTSDNDRQYLPQFKLIKGVDYLKDYQDIFSFDTLLPQFALDENSEIQYSPLWQHAVALNLFELTQLFEDKITYEEAVMHHQAGVSPLSRLGYEHIHYLWNQFC